MVPPGSPFVSANLAAPNCIPTVFSCSGFDQRADAWDKLSIQASIGFEG